MRPDPHARTDKLFAKLIAQRHSADSKAILQALHWLCILTEEVSIGLQAQAEEVNRLLGELIDKIDALEK